MSRDPSGAGPGTVIAMVVIAIVMAVPAGVAWTVIFTRDKGPELVRWVGRKRRKRWAQ